MQILQQGGHCLPDNTQRSSNRDNSWWSDTEREQRAQIKGSFHLYHVCVYSEYTEKCAVNNIQKCRHASTGKHQLQNSSVLPFPRIPCTKIEAWSSCSLAGLARDPASDTDLLSELVMVTLTPTNINSPICEGTLSQFYSEAESINAFWKMWWSRILTLAVEW